MSYSYLITQLLSGFICKAEPYSRLLPVSDSPWQNAWLNGFMVMLLNQYALMKAANKVFSTIKFTYICCKRSVTGSFLLVKG